MVYQTPEFTLVIGYMMLLFADFLGYFYLILKIYRILCFSKITFDQLPLLNPYKWPLSLVRITTKPYFRFWSKMLPKLKLGKAAYDMSAILGLEMLSIMISCMLQFRAFVLLEVQQFLV